jgi:hypothetical protein
MGISYYLYYHLNPKTNDLFYVGIGTDKRAWEFKAGRNKHYLNYIKKFGKPIVYIKEYGITLPAACLLEIKYIKTYGRKGYEKNGILVNKSLGGEAAAFGIKQSLETRLKKSKSMTGKQMHSVEQKEKWSKERKGKSTNWDPNHTKADKGRPKPKEFGDKLSKPIHQYDLDGNFIKEWVSCREAHRVLGIHYGSISLCCLGKGKTAGKFIWKYK